jgi:primosomal protein N' (replication factor Y)
VYVQSRFPDHPIFQELRAQSFERFAARALEDRRESCSPPFMFQAMLRAEAPTLDRALGFLQRARLAAPEDEGIALYDPVPMSVMRLMDSERGQLLVEAENRGGLHRFLEAWCAGIQDEPGVNWAIEVDPVDL